MNSKLSRTSFTLDKDVLKIKELSSNDHIPIIEDEVIDFLTFYLRHLDVKYILEIGTGYGFSAAIFRKSFPDASITTVERREKNFLIAKKLLKEMDITVVNMDASDYIELRKEKIDLLFLDGAKSHYKELFDKARTLLSSGSIVISDNIYARGITFGDHVDKRNRTIKRNMNRFIDEIFKEDYESYIIPIGDGLAITRIK